MANSQSFKVLVQEAIDNWSTISEGLSAGNHYDETFLNTYGDQIRALVQYHNDMVNFTSKYLPVNVRPDIRYKDTNNNIISPIEEACWYLITIEVTYHTYSLVNNEPVFSKATATYSNLTMSSPNPNNPELITNQVPIGNEFPVSIKVSINKPFGNIGNGPELFLVDGSGTITDDMLNNIIKPDNVINIGVPGYIVIGYKQGSYHKLHWINITKQVLWLMPNPLFRVTPTEIRVASSEPNPSIESVVYISNAGSVVRGLTITPELIRTQSNVDTISSGYITVIEPDGNVQQLGYGTPMFFITKFGQYQFYMNDLSSYKKLVNVILEAIDIYMMSTDFYTQDNHYASICEYSSIGTNGVVQGNSLPIGRIIEGVFSEAIANMGVDVRLSIIKNFVYAHCMLPWLHQVNSTYNHIRTTIMDELMLMFFDINLAQKPSISNDNTVTLSIYDSYDNLVLSTDYSISPGVGNNPFEVSNTQYGAVRLALNSLIATVINNYNNSYWKCYISLTPHDTNDEDILADNISGSPSELHIDLSLDEFTSSVGVIADSQHYDNDPVNVTVTDLSSVYPELIAVPSGSSSNLSQLRLSDNIWSKISFMDLTSYYDTFDQLASDFTGFGYDIISHLAESKLVFGTSNGHIDGNVLNYNYIWISSLNQYFNSGDLTLFEPFYFIESLFLQNSGQSGESSTCPGIDKLFVTMTGFYDLYHCVREIESFDTDNLTAKVGGGSIRGVNFDTIDKMILRCNGVLNFTPRVYNPDLIYSGGSWSMPISEFPKSLLQALMEVNKPHDAYNWAGNPWFYRINDADQDYDYADPHGFDYLERPFGSTSPRRLTQFIFPFPGLYELTAQITESSSSYNQYSVPIYVRVSPIDDYLFGLKIDIINGYHTNLQNSDNQLYNQLLKPMLPNGLNMGKSDTEFEGNGIRVIRPRSYTMANGFNKAFNIIDRF